VFVTVANSWHVGGGSEIWTLLVKVKGKGRQFV